MGFSALTSLDTSPSLFKKAQHHQELEHQSFVILQVKRGTSPSSVSSNYCDKLMVYFSDTLLTGHSAGLAECTALTAGCLPPPNQMSAQPEDSAWLSLQRALPDAPSQCGIVPTSTDDVLYLYAHLSMSPASLCELPGSKDSMALFGT